MTKPRGLVFTVNGKRISVAVEPVRRLSEVLREELQLTGTKVGCEAGDCGACTVLLDGAQICACLVPTGQVVGRDVETVEALAGDAVAASLQNSFLRHGAAQCGICTPGMLMAAVELLRRKPNPDEQDVKDALGGVLCRCTGYRKIIDAVLDAAGTGTGFLPPAGEAVGAAMPRVDGSAKVLGTEIFGADRAPEGSLLVRVVRSPHARAQFTIGNLDTLYERHPGLVRVLTAGDVTGNNGFGIYPTVKDQPVLADGVVRFRGEAVAALVGDEDAVNAIRDEDLPIEWSPEEPVTGMASALAEGAPPVQSDKPDNVLVRGRLSKGDVEPALAGAAHRVEQIFETASVEHAYIEPEAGYARRVGDRLEIFVSTQAPYLDRDETAQVLGLAPEQVRIIPSACGGGFGGKLDVSVQPIIGLAAWLLERPVRCTYSRPESMASSTKRHPSVMTVTAGCDDKGRVLAYEFTGDFDTGAYTSWGPTVADRVPIHCSGPYFVANVRAATRAVLTNAPPSGAFRGFGVPQAAIAHEGIMDILAGKAGIDPLEMRLMNAIRAGQPTATGQVLASVGMEQCLLALKPRWTEWRAAAGAASTGSLRRGVGIGCVWYGCGNTALPNPSTIRVGIDGQGNVTLYNGAVDIGQGANTVMVQICADALGIEASVMGYVMGDTDLTADAGKTSASRQTFVSGKAAELAGRDLRKTILRMTNAGDEARIEIGNGRIAVQDGTALHEIDLSALPAANGGDVLTGTGSFDPPTTPLDENSQGEAYATYGFGAQIVEVDVDIELGVVRATRVAAAHDVGRAINPMLLEGQIEGGVAQGLGMALMEEYVPGRTENLHDYLVPTIGDIPPIESILIEEPEPHGPYGAKGVGEHALVPTAPAILGAIHHATGVRINRVPATPDRIRAAILEAKNHG
jgi:CO/xanthine dehydrogenase Mo-binding subunit/aerobic-type carbon monoxide dehydrogenase small subunit (CoxS/CutS family)